MEEQPKNYTPLQVKEDKSVKPGPGRPTIITNSVVAHLEQLFKLGVTVITACRYAEISRDAFYDRYKSDSEFAYRMDKAQEFPRIAAGNVVINAIVNDKDVATSRWYLEKKYKSEFGGGPEVAIQVNNNLAEKKEAYGI